MENTNISPSQQSNNAEHPEQLVPTQPTANAPEVAQQGMIEHPEILEQSSGQTLQPIVVSDLQQAGNNINAPENQEAKTHFFGPGYIKYLIITIIVIVAIGSIVGVIVAQKPSHKPAKSNSTQVSSGKTTSNLHVSNTPLSNSSSTSTSNPAGTEAQVPPRQSSAETALEKKLASNSTVLAKLRSFSLPIYVPRGQQIDNPSLGTNTSNGITTQVVSYGINTKFGQGLVPGTYGVSMFTLDSSFNPPSDCELPNGGPASSPIACTPFSGSSQAAPAYSYQGQEPGGITNTNVPASSYITLYIRKGTELITIQTSGASAEQLYQLFNSMTLINPVDMPENTLVGFY